MKRLQVLFLSILVTVSFVCIAAASPSQIVPKTKHYSKKTYHKGRWVTKTTYHHGKKITKKVWVKSNHIGGKVVHKTKTIVMGDKHQTP